MGEMIDADKAPAGAEGITIFWTAGAVRLGFRVGGTERGAILSPDEAGAIAGRIADYAVKAALAAAVQAREKEGDRGAQC